MAGVARPAALDARMPEPLLEEPPKDRWCDLVLTGGVASGVVYPWAIVELARQFRFRNIGGTSVGALAAAIAAASEYGRRHGQPHAYEVLRQLPVELAEMVEGGPGADDRRTRMLSLFQPAAAGRRLFRVFLAVLAAMYHPTAMGGRAHRSSPPRPWLDRLGLRNTGDADRSGDTDTGEPDTAAELSRGTPVLRAVICSLLEEYGATVWGWWLGAAVAGFAGLALGILVQPVPALASFAPWLLHLGLAAALVFLLLGVVRLVRAMLTDFRDGLLKHDFGLCRGTSTETDSRGHRVPALSDWMHEGIQRAAGLAVDGPPLTFQDLWHAPLTPGGPRPRTAAQGVPAERSINLEMVTTNVTHGRPYRLPLTDRDARLFFDPVAWAGFFPPVVMAALRRSSAPYRPASTSDPRLPLGAEGLLELPAGQLPVVVAARLSLSFPLLFAALPLYAIDYEDAERTNRRLRLCRFSDGGLCSNFPVHFFDSALPRWPTFGIWLQQRSPLRPHVAVWLPEYQGDGRGDSWQRFEPVRAQRGSRGRGPPIGGTVGDPASDVEPTPSTLLKFLRAAVQSAKDWGDQTAMRMPHVRRRVVRVMLKSDQGEGELNIAMKSGTIVEMAATYGTAAGRALCKAYAPEGSGQEPAQAWREHLWVRLQVLLDGLAGLLRNFGDAAASRGHTLDIEQLLAQAQAVSPIQSLSDARTLRPEQARELADLVRQIERLGAALSSRSGLPHPQRPAPELRLRPPL